VGFALYVICDDGDYISFGKEIEVYANHDQAVAMLKFFFDKSELGKDIHILRFGLDKYYESVMERDVSEEYLKDAREELSY